jgi:Lrp/AsnC family transcriptional regulator for asnA, asnC and gidA
MSGGMTGVPVREEGPRDEFELDELDLRIITELQDDGRKPSTEIARKLGMPRTTVARRIERLVSQKIITIGVFANSQRIGLPLHVMIEVEVEPRKHAAVVAAAVKLEEIRWVGTAIGHYDILIEGMLRSNEHLQHFLVEVLGAIDGVTRLRTSQILGIEKLAFNWEQMLSASPDKAATHKAARSTTN